MNAIQEQFYAGIEQAYASLERRLMEYRKEYLEFCRTNTQYWSDQLLTPIPIMHGVHKTHQRVVIPLNDGYLAKIRPAGHIAERAWYMVCDPDNRRGQKPTHPEFQEEQNSNILKKYGVTQEHGFYIPIHQVVGIAIEGEDIKVNQNGTGVTLTEDVSEGGRYLVCDLQPYHFFELKNGDALYAAYKQHLHELKNLYDHPNIRATIRRHGAPKNPLDSLSRMLLVKIKDETGSLVIGDLDNILFEEHS